MANRAASRVHRVRAGVIVALFVVAVAGAAAVGWWYARESPPHQGPIVLIALDGFPTRALPAYGGQRTDTPGIDTLASDAVVFDRVYTHSVQMLPAHASILSGQLPFEHGVHDDAGFVLGGDVRTLAESLRSRGFATGAAVSSFLLRPSSGIAQGFSFYDAERPEPAGDSPVLDRDGHATVEAAERWVQSQDDQRFFLFVQVGATGGDAAVARLVELLKTRGEYDGATVVLVGDRGDVGPGLALDEASLSVPLLIKQPAASGSGRHVNAPVQHIDLTPTILDLVRAPLPSSLHGRSLRAVLDGGPDTLAPQPIYSESLAAHYRFGGQPVYTLTDVHRRFVQGVSEELVAVGTPESEGGGGEAADTGRLRSDLEHLVGTAPLPRPSPIDAADQEPYALAGFLASPALPPAPAPALTADEQTALVAAHHAAATLVGQKKYSAGIRALRAMASGHPMLAAVHYQLGTVLVRTGRAPEAIEAFRTTRELQPESAEAARSLADALLRAGDVTAAREQAEEAVTLSLGEEPSWARAAAHEMAARVALAQKDGEAAAAHAEAVEAADPAIPVLQFVRGRLLYEDAQYEEAAVELQQAAEVAAREGGRALADLHLYLGETYAQLERYDEAEAQYREELRAFPRSLQAYSSLAMLYRATNRLAAIEDVVDELVASTPTPEGYAVAARLWTVLGDRSRADALRSDARSRFRGDPSLALLGRDGQR